MPTVDTFDARFTKLESAIFRLGERMDAGFERIEEQFHQIDNRLVAVDARFDLLDRKIEGEVGGLRVELEAKMDEKIDELAGMVARGFMDMENRFVEVRTDIARLDTRIDAVYNELAPRVSKLEEQAIKF